MEAAREVIRQMGFDERWQELIDPDMPPELLEFARRIVRAYQEADLDWLLSIGHPDIVISQPPELPGARVYTGSEALLDALLDWPRQWADFRIEGRRIFAPDDEHIAVVTIHRGRPRTVDIEVEAEFVFLIRREDGLVTCWDMFMSV